MSRLLRSTETDSDRPGRATHIDPLDGIAFDAAGNAVNPDPLPALVARINANICEAMGVPRRLMGRDTYLRQGSSILASLAASGVVLPARGKRR